MSPTNALIIPAAQDASATNGTNASGLRDIRPPVEIPNGWVWLAWTLALFALVATGVWIWGRWIKQRSMTPPAPVIPPHVRARRRLDAALSLIGDPKEFCIEVSAALRIYLEERFQFRAPERTTEEFLHELKSTDLLWPDQKQALAEFLEQCDLVKFACFEPTETKLRALHESALRLVDETEPAAQPVAAPSEETR